MRYYTAFPFLQPVIRAVAHGSVVYFMLFFLFSYFLYHVYCYLIIFLYQRDILFVVIILFVLCRSSVHQTFLNHMYICSEEDSLWL